MRTDDAGDRPGGWQRPVVHLLRHGETVEYRTDAGLTPTGREQAHAAGLRLAELIPAGDDIRIRCSPRVRTHETALGLRAGLLDGYAARRARYPGLAAPRVSVPLDEPGLDNFRVLVDDAELEVTAAFGLLERARDHRASDRPDPGWVAEADRFWRIQEEGGDPIGHWLRQPSQHLESAPHVVRRVWATLARVVADEPAGDHVVLCTHSGPIRALVAQAFGEDPGEPGHLEELVVRFECGGERAELCFRTRRAEMEVPVGVTPSWFA